MLRAVFVSLGKAERFACKHVDQVKKGTVSKALDTLMPKKDRHRSV